MMSVISRENQRLKSMTNESILFLAYYAQNINSYLGFDQKKIIKFHCPTRFSQIGRFKASLISSSVISLRSLSISYTLFKNFPNHPLEPCRLAEMQEQSRHPFCCSHKKRLRYRNLTSWTSIKDPVCADPRAALHHQRIHAKHEHRYYLTSPSGGHSRDQYDRRR